MLQKDKTVSRHNPKYSPIRHKKRLNGSCSAMAVWFQNQSFRDSSWENILWRYKLFCWWETSGWNCGPCK